MQRPAARIWQLLWPNLVEQTREALEDAKKAE